MKEARPFYELPDHVRTSGRIVQEARNSMTTGVGGLRTIDTARPFTPRDESRALFRRSSAREGRPPSAFSVSTLEFEASTSRPTSGSTPTALEPLTDLHRPVIHTEGHRVVSPHFPRPPSGDPQGRPRPPSTASSGEPPSPLLSIPPPTGQKSLIKHKLERQRSRSINELAHPLPSCHALHDAENESSQRRVQSGPKERTTPEPEDECDKSSTKGRAGSNRPTTPSVKVSRTASLASNSAEDDELWSETISPLLDDLVKAKAAEDWSTCGALGMKLLGALEGVSMFSRKSKPKHRAPILKICFRLLDCGEAKAVLPIIKCILKFKVGGNNLSNACRLLFKFAKNEANDDLFLRSDLLTPLLETLSSTRLSSAEDGVVYAAGALKFLSSNPTIVKELANLDAIETMGRILNKGVEDLARSRNDTQELAVVSNALVQLTSTVRNLSELPGTRTRLLHSGLLQSLVFFLKLFPRDTELALNISRILSKLTLCDDVCSHLLDFRCDEVGSERGVEDPLFTSLFAILTTHVQKADLVVRVLFILGNLTAKSDEARVRLWELRRKETKKGPSSVDTGSVKILVTTFLNYVDMMGRELKEEPTVGEGPNKVEDVLIKLVRIIANLSINEEIGGAIASDEILVGLLVRVLEMTSFHKDEDPPNELLLNATATINNLSYYMIEEDNIGTDLGEATESMLGLARSLRPMAHSANEECILEAARVFGNLSQIRQVRHFMVDNSMDKLFITLLDSTNRELVFTSVGILINLMVDRENRHIIKKESGVQKLVDVLRDFGQNDWHLASMVCQVFWNMSEKINSSYDCFGNPEADDLCDVLTEFLDEQVVLGLESSDEMDEETRRIVGSLWRDQFCPVAARLLQRVESHLTDLEPIQNSEDFL